MGSLLKRAKAVEADGERQVRAFKAAIAHRFFVRFHMSLILSGVVLSGVTASKLLMMLGLRLMLFRYMLAVLLAYGVFFLLVRLWIWYVLPKSAGSGSGGSLLDNVSLGDGGAIGGGSSGGGGGGFQGFGGGRSGGGGASGVWDTAPSPPVAPMALQPAPSTGGLSGSSLFSSIEMPDLDGKTILVLVAFGLLVAVICGAGAYLIYAAPNILPEAAFQGALAVGLRKPARNMASTGWENSILGSTWIPLLIVLVMAMLLGWVAGSACPSASKLSEVLHCSGG